jgi:3-hydroxy-D-aspartate aldolase
MDRSAIGMEKEQIDTPALLIDLDILEKNIQTMSEYYRGRKGAALRPHQKGHRLPVIARKQLKAGAVGVSMTSFGLAEHYVRSGIKNILITSEVYGENKIKRLCELGKLADIVVGIDNIKNVRQLSEQALVANTRVKVAAEIYMGPESCGVEIEEVESFVKRVVKFEGVIFDGLWWHQGALSSIRDWKERKREHFRTLDKVSELKDNIEDAGINVRMLSGGFTCTWNITPLYARLHNVEVQAGSYVFSDWCSHTIEGLEQFGFALTVLTRCISKPRADRAIFDFGMNSCSDECTYDYHEVVGPKFRKLDSVKSIFEREEISFAMLSKSDGNVKVGETYELVPPHSDTTAKLYDQYYCIRKGRVEAIWCNLGRGLF